MLMPSSQLRDLDLVRWLENKLGNSNELWSGRQAASLLSREMLIELETCFQALEPHVKLKIILAIPHLSYRLITMWKEPLLNLLDLARRDADDWIETVADMYREYPTRQCIIPYPSNEESYFCRSLEILRQIVLKHSNAGNLKLLPMDVCAVSERAIKAQYGLEKLENRKHFNLRKRPKSAALKEEVIKLAEVNANRAKNQKSDVLSTSFPIRMRSTARKPNNDLPMRGIPTTNTCKLSAGFTNEPRRFPRQLPKRGGAKLLDIQELPQALKIRRKEQEAEEKARKQQEKEEQKKRLQAERAEKEARRAAAAQKAQETSAAVLSAATATTVPNAEVPVSQEALPEQMVVVREPTQSQGMLVSSSSVQQVPPKSAQNMSYGDVRELPTMQYDQQQQHTAGPKSPSRREQRDAYVRRQCEEMLGNANVLNEEGHRMVTAFMSGNKTHPFPHLGDIVTLKLSESYEDEVGPGGVTQKLRVETFFQMDYRSGEWKRLRKIRAVRLEDVPQQATGFQPLQTATPTMG